MTVLRHMHAALMILASTMATAGAAAAQAPDALTVGTASGPVTGAAIKGVDTWLGIPYAAPPVGPLRWQPPQPAGGWTVPIKANTLPSSCAQNADLGVFARAGGSEDCLYLNVYRGTDAARSG